MIVRTKLKVKYGATMARTGEFRASSTKTLFHCGTLATYVKSLSARLPNWKSTFSKCITSFYPRARKADLALTQRSLHTLHNKKIRLILQFRCVCLWYVLTLTILKRISTSHSWAQQRLLVHQMSMNLQHPRRIDSEETAQNTKEGQTTANCE